jgi:manganese transport system ATP-binding protein
VRPVPVNGDAVVGRAVVLGYGSSVAVTSSTFNIPAGQVTVVIGPNGSGKSTLLSAIAGLIEPAAGALEVASRGPGSRRIAYVLQHTRVNDALPVSVREVVTMGRYAGAGGYRLLKRADREAVAEAMDRTGITGIAGEHLHRLSGGQRQRVFVAQGLAQEHDLLLLDEPMTGIDIPTARAIDAVIHDERGRGCTIVIATHDLSEARVADHVLLMSGRVVACGPPEDVLTPDHLVAAYGPSLLHADEGGIFIDDPAHRRPVDGDG